MRLPRVTTGRMMVAMAPIAIAIFIACRIIPAARMSRLYAVLEALWRSTYQDANASFGPEANVRGPRHAEWRTKFLAWEAGQIEYAARAKDAYRRASTRFWEAVLVIPPDPDPFPPPLPD